MVKVELQLVVLHMAQVLVLVQNLLVGLQLFLLLLIKENGYGQEQLTMMVLLLILKPIVGLMVKTVMMVRTVKMERTEKTARMGKTDRMELLLL